MTNEERMARLAETIRAIGMSVEQAGQALANFRQDKPLPLLLVICAACYAATPDAEYCVECGQQLRDGDNPYPIIVAHVPIKPS